VVVETLYALQGQLRHSSTDRLRRRVRQTARRLLTDRLDLMFFVLGLAAVGMALFRAR
jgi:hypothetical protein